MEGGAFYKGLLEALAQGMGTAKGYLFEHGPRTAVLTISLGKRFGLTEEDLADLFFAAVLADLGMIGLVGGGVGRPRSRCSRPSPRAEVESPPASKRRLGADDPVPGSIGSPYPASP